MEKATGGKGVDPAFDDLHNQFHALNDAFCGVTSAQAKTPAYDLARDAQEGIDGYLQAALEI